MAGRQRRLAIVGVLLLAGGAALWHLVDPRDGPPGGGSSGAGGRHAAVRLAPPHPGESAGGARGAPDADAGPHPALEGGIALVGRILDVGGGVVPGAHVEARMIDASAPPGSSPLGAQATADEAGTYRLALPAGRYLLIARAGGYAPAYDWVGLVIDTTRDLRLSPAARISGRVLERHNRQPVPEAILAAVRDRMSPGGPTPEVQADAQGRFQLSELEPGIYRVQGRKGRLLGQSEAIALAATDVVEGIEVLVDPGLVIEGRVIDSQGQGVSGAEVALDRSGPLLASPLRARSEKGGTFRLEGVWPGPVRLSARAPGRVPARLDLLVSRDERGLELRLEAGGSVAGRVEAEDGAPVDGAEIQVRVRPEPGSKAAGRASGPTGPYRTTTGQDGRFSLEALPTGLLSLDARHPERGAASAERIPLSEGEKQSLVLRLEAGGLVEGTVRTAAGAPAAGARVTVVGGNAGASATTTVDAQGRYRFAQLTPGSYQIVAGTGGVMAFGGPDRPDRAGFDLSAREREQIDLVVDGGQQISGVVLGPSGQPVEGAEITASAGSAAQVNRRGPAAARGFADADGAFVLQDLGAGPYTLFAAHPGFADLERPGVAGGTQRLSLRLAPESTLAGVVVAPSGKPVQHYSIYLTPAPPPGETAVQKAQRRRRGPVHHPADLVHDRSGRFFFGRVGPGTYLLEVVAADGSRGSLAIEVARGERREGLRVVSTDPAPSVP